jgi:hypothetical protein
MVIRSRVIPPRTILTVAALGLAIVVRIGAASVYLPQGIDWHLTLRPSILTLLTTSSPYTATPLAPFAGAPWGLWVLWPVALLPEPVGRAVLLFISLAALTFSARRLGARPFGTAIFLLSPPILHCLLNGNLDWMPVLGFVLPPPIGLFLLAVKPQRGSVVAIFWLVEAWRRGRWREVLTVFGPITLALGLSLLIYGLWPLNALFIFKSPQTWNASLWPASIPVGLALAWAALRKREIRFAMAASPCLSPYVLFHSWSGAVAAVIGLPGEAFATFIDLWILVAIRGLAL